MPWVESGLPGKEAGLGNPRQVVGGDTQGRKLSQESKGKLEVGAVCEGSNNLDWNLEMV